MNDEPSRTNHDTGVQWHNSDPERADGGGRVGSHPLNIFFRLQRDHRDPETGIPQQAFAWVERFRLIPTGSRNPRQPRYGWNGVHHVHYQQQFIQQRLRNRQPCVRKHWR